jgi:hypothetical protein
MRIGEQRLKMIKPSQQCVPLLPIIVANVGLADIKE